MKIEGINLETTLAKVRKQLEEEPNISPTLKASIELMLTLFTLMLNRLGLDSKISSKPPSSDPNRAKKQRAPSNRKPGAQNGRIGTTLVKVGDPDEIKFIPIDRSTLPGGDYRSAGYEARQVVDIDISRFVTEYQAEILLDQKGKRYVAPFPEEVKKAIQYGNSVKEQAVYQSQYQLIPYERVQEYFADQLGIPVSPGSIFNFNQAAYDKLETFEAIVKSKLKDAAFLHSDETGINIQSKRLWLHCLSSDRLTFLYPHAKRGKEAMDEMGVLPEFDGVLCHDHWKPYFKYNCKHALCNAHHLRELERAIEQDKQHWAERLKLLLLEINKAVEGLGGYLKPPEADAFRQRYRAILKEGEAECPPPEKRKRGARGRIAKSKARNLLERLINHEDDVLRFMENPVVTFTNNQGEHDLRMTKVQQKISGCFRSMDGAKIFCRVRSYLSTCRKNGMTASEALNLLFNDKLPEFLTNL